MKHLLFAFITLFGFLNAETYNRFDYALEVLMSDEKWEDAEFRAGQLMCSDDIEDRLQGAFAAAYIAYEQDYWLQARWYFTKVGNTLREMRKERLKKKDPGDNECWEEGVLWARE